MNEELNKKVNNEKDSKRKTIVFGIVFLFTILFIVIIAFAWYDSGREEKRPTNSNTNIENHYNYDYKYVVQTYFGADCFIYLLRDDSVKVVVKTPVYDTCEGTNCLVATGEFDYEETSIQFSDKSMDKVREFITSLFKNKREKYINLEGIKLSSSEERIEMALLLNTEDMITFEDDLMYDTAVQQLKNSAGKVIIKNSKTNIASSSNKIVNTIGNYLNVIVNKEWEKLAEESKKVIAEGLVIPENGELGIEYSLKLEDLGATTVSFVYSMNGTLGGVPWGDLKGYVFNSANGELKEYPNGWKEEAYTEALESFKKKDDYKNSKDNLIPNWENVLKENIFTTGNWYLKEDKIIFLIPETLIMESPVSSHVIEIEIENTFGNF